MNENEPEEQSQIERRNVLDDPEHGFRLRITAMDHAVVHHGVHMGREELVKTAQSIEAYLRGDAVPTAKSAEAGTVWQRVAAERDDLRDKMIRLSNFMLGAEHNALPDDEKLRLANQLDAMAAYAKILEERLDFAEVQ